ncbi:hypothetical protein ACFVWT_17130 [Arthrobacter sp. NPDC058288]|uniref:hypothetical protein n=1 Tax=Arthrobacter sp. NPDC058288 TaxID=3346424 RepID=UPI0036E9FA65
MEPLTAAENTDNSTDARLMSLMAELTLAEKVQLLTGPDFWTTWPLEKIGLRRMLFSDGPTGVRGEVWDEREPSMNFPSAAAISSSWDPAIAAAATADTVLPVTITLTNTGARTGKSVVQVYAEKPGFAVDRPVRWLVASVPVWAEAAKL